MYAVIGIVRIKPGHEEETAAMARERGPLLVGGMPGSKAAYWARPVDESGEVLQHSFWLFETEADARAAETVMNSLREMPEAPAEMVSTEVCEVISTM
jgi:heme-degrading monooxygenase HmoA